MRDVIGQNRDKYVCPSYELYRLSQGSKEKGSYKVYKDPNNLCQVPSSEKIRHLQGGSSSLHKIFYLGKTPGSGGVPARLGSRHLAKGPEEMTIPISSPCSSISFGHVSIISFGPPESTHATSSSFPV